MRYPISESYKESRIQGQNIGSYLGVYITAGEFFLSGSLDTVYPGYGILHKLICFQELNVNYWNEEFLFLAI